MELEDVRHYRLVYAANRERPVNEWAHLTAFPWVSLFSAGELVEFDAGFDKLIAAGDLGELADYIGACKDTADVYSNPDVLAAMLEDGPAEEVFPPSYYGYYE